MSSNALLLDWFTLGAWPSITSVCRPSSLMAGRQCNHVPQSITPPLNLKQALSAQGIHLVNFDLLHILVDLHIFYCYAEFGMPHT